MQSHHIASMDLGHVGSGNRKRGWDVQKIARPCGDFVVVCPVACALKPRFPYGFPVSRCGLAARRLAGKQKDLGSIRFGSHFSSLQKLWFMDTVL